MNTISMASKLEYEARKAPELPLYQRISGRIESFFTGKRYSTVIQKNLQKQIDGINLTVRCLKFTKLYSNPPNNSLQAAIDAELAKFSEKQKALLLAKEYYEMN